MKPQLLLSLCFICNIGFLYGQASIIEQVSVKLTSQLEKPFTAAFYKDIPIGTLILIKNPKNQKSIVVEITGLSLNIKPLIEITPTGMSRLAIEEYDKVEISYISDNNTLNNTPNEEQTSNTNPFEVDVTTTNNDANKTTHIIQNLDELYKRKPKITQAQTKAMVLESNYLKDQKICFHRTLPIGNQVYIRRKGTENLFLATVVGRLQGKNIPADVTIQLSKAYFDEISNSSKEKIIDADSFSELGNINYLDLDFWYKEIINVFEEGICKPSASKLLLGSVKFALHKTAPIGTRILLEVIDDSNEDSNSNRNRRNAYNPFGNSNEIKTSQIFVFEVIGKLEDTSENKNVVLVVGEQLFKNYNTSEEKSLPVKISYFEE